MIDRRKKFFGAEIMKQCEKCGNIPQELSRNWLGFNENKEAMEISCYRCGFTWIIEMEDIDNG